jgi:dihydroorotate dehydrogenase (NAD+) catalytic subunit
VHQTSFSSTIAVEIKGSQYFMPSAGQTVLYDPTKTFDDNFNHGPFPTTSEIATYKNTGQPSYTFLGKPVYTLFGIPAGPLPTSKHTSYAFEHGFDIVCYKTQRSVPFPCNDFPNVVYLDVDGDLTLEKAAQPLVGHTVPMATPDKLTITNSFGNPSRGPVFWADDLKEAVSGRGEGQFLIASVVGTIQPNFTADDYYDDFAVAAEQAAAGGVDAIELNLSCPNVASEGVLCYTHDAVIEICKRTRAKIGDLPLIAKIGYFDASQQTLLETIVSDAAPYIDAISAINTISAPVVDEAGEQLLPGEGRLKSGCCGAGIKWAGLDMVKRLDSIRKEAGLSYQIIGVGGVMTPTDYKQYIAAGANAVQSATGAMWNPELGIEIKQSL